VWWWLATAPAAPVTLSEAIDAALADNRDLVTARWAVVASEGRLTAGESAWDPVLTASASTSTQQSAGFVAGYPLDATTDSSRAALGVSAAAPTGTALALDGSLQHDTTTTVSQLGGVESTQENSNWTTSVGATLTQDLLAPLRTQPEAVTVRQAREARTQAELERDAAEQQVVVTAASAWWTAWAAGEAVRATEARVVVARALEDTTRAQLAEGTLAALEVDRATADRLSAERSLVGARADEQDARDALAVAMGGRPGDDPSAAGAGDVDVGAPGSAEALWERVAARDPSLLLAIARRDAARAASRDASDGWLPTLDAVGSVGTGALQDDAAGAWTAMVGDGGLPRASVSLQLIAPLGAHAARGRRDETAAALRSAESAVEAAEATLRASLRSAVTDLDTARATVELARLRVTVARATEAGEQARVDEGASRLDQLLDARAARLEAEADLRTATAEAGRARIALDAMLGAEVGRE
jgi:outer membrane protein TolC